MEFEGQYLTYVEYKALGGTLDQTPFNVLEFEARKQIDLRTQNRLKGLEEIPKEVKMCDFHLINKIKTYAEISNEATKNGTIASENTDGYSISYVNATQVDEIIKSKNADIQDVIVNDLYGVIVKNTHLIYNGVI